MTGGRIRILSALAVLAFVATACGDDDDSASTDDVGSESTTASSGSSEAPSSEAPSSEAPSSEAPSSEAPSSEAPSGAEAPGRAADADTVVIGWTGDYNSLDPPDSLVEWNREATIALYDQLLYYDLTEQPDGTLVWNGLEVAPALAETWDVEENSVTFHLRDDATFYPSGNPVTADDVKYTFERAIEVPGFGAFNSNLAGIFEPSRQITVIDDQTVRFDFELSDGTPFLLTASLPSLRFPQFGIVDSEVVKSHATEEDPWGHEWLKENTAGSGPYYIESHSPGTELVLQARDDHWSGTPNYDRAIFRILSSPADITSLMLGGEVDLTFALPAQQLDALRDAGFNIVNAAIPDIWRVDITVDTPPLDDANVRQAIAYAIPYDAIIENVFAEAERAYSYVNPAAPEFAPTWDMYETDLDQARALLEEAGLGDGFSTDLYYNSGLAESENMALLIQASLAEIGIDVTLQPLPTTQFAEQTTAQVDGENVMEGLTIRNGVIWLDDADPNTGLWVLTDGFSNATHYGREDLDAMHLENRFNPNLDERTAAYVTIQEEVAQDAPFIPVAVKGRPGAVHPAVSGVAFTADPHLRTYLLHPAE
jgi:peptide/nickel transport system substrate-binding protein